MFPSVVEVGREVIIVESAILSSGVGYDWGLGMGVGIVCVEGSCGGEEGIKSRC